MLAGPGLAETAYILPLKWNDGGDLSLVIADDDVRYTRESLERVVSLLADADVVRPQNYFEDLGPWRARCDTARTLINRAFGSDYPGTPAVLRTSRPPGR